MPIPIDLAIGLYNSLYYRTSRDLNICYAVIVDRIDRKVRPVIIISAVNNTRFTRVNVPVTVKVMLREPVSGAGCM